MQLCETWRQRESRRAVEGRHRGHVFTFDAAVYYRSTTAGEAWLAPAPAVMVGTGPVVDGGAVHDHGARSGPGTTNRERGAEIHLVMVVLGDHTETSKTAGEGRGHGALAAGLGPR